MSRHAAPEPSPSPSEKPKSKAVTLLVILGLYLLHFGLAVLVVWITGPTAEPQTKNAGILLSLVIGFIIGSQALKLWNARHGN